MIREDRLQKMQARKQASKVGLWLEKRNVIDQKTRVFLASVESSCRVHARLSTHACRLRSNPQQRSWCFHNKHNLFVVGAKSMGMKIGEGYRNVCILFDLITQRRGRYRRARMFMLLEMVRASIRKENGSRF